MQFLATPAPQRPTRSFSYNDLKKKRLLRSQKSQRKLANGEFQQSTIKKKCNSEVKSILASVPQDERVIVNCINELKGVLGSLRGSSSKKRVITVRESMTDRPSTSRYSIEMQIKQKPVWWNVQEAGDTKQLIKNLMNKNRSQRKLVSFNEVRDKLKKEKERSRSKDGIQMKETTKVKPIVSPLKEKRELKVIEQQEKDPHIRSTQPTLLNSNTTNHKSKEMSLEEVINSCNTSKIWQEEIAGKQNTRINKDILGVQELSSIKKATNCDQFDESELKLLNDPQVPGSFLKYLRDQGELKSGIQVKQIRRKKELDRVKRIFPAGFF